MFKSYNSNEILMRFWPELSARKYHYEDNEITFYMQVKKDFALMEKSVSSLRRYFPDSPVIVVSDGKTNDSKLNAISKSLRINFIEGEYLYSLNSGGKIIQRMFKYFLTKPTSFLIKIDSDTIFHRRFNYLIDETAIFGSIQRSGRLFSIQGGFVGMSLSAVKQLNDCKMLEDSILINPLLSWAKGAPAVAKDALKQQKIRFEWVLAYLAKIKKIPLKNYKEVKSTWKNCSWRGAEYRFAATHPHKLFKSPVDN